MSGWKDLMRVASRPKEGRRGASPLSALKKTTLRLFCAQGEPRMGGRGRNEAAVFGRMAGRDCTAGVSVLLGAHLLLFRRNGGGVGVESIIR